MIVPVLLCGGSGTRLWPLSRKSYPKQFVPLMGEESLFQASARRVTGAGYAPPVVAAGVDFRFIVTEQLAEIGVKPSAILIEPDGRNTAPAVLAAAFWLEKTDPEALMLATPADHVAPDAAAFRRTVEAGIPAAQDGKLVTFGVAPSYPETGYGYLELAEAAGEGELRPLALKRFVEKPNAARAAEMLASGRSLWTAGVFLFSVKAVLEAFRRHAPEMIGPVEESVSRGATDHDFLRLDAQAWSGAPAISVDYAVMEKAENLAVVPFRASWSDLGGWDAVWRESPRDSRGVSTSGAATALDCSDSLLRSEDERVEIVGIGLKNVIAVATPDAVLVADASRAQDVRAAVSALKAKGVKQAEASPKDHRPWGWFETLVLGERFQVKRIVVRPGAALSLQSHHHRSEHWIVVQGTALVTVDGEKKLLSENQSTYIPLGAVHRMENPGKIPLMLIEVQTGAYLGEDDIIRYEDVYARGQGAKG